MSYTRVALILGGGANIGAALASKFKAHGFHVAIVSRKAPSAVDKDEFLRIQADVGKPEDISKAFEITQEKFGAPASAVVYNVARLTVPPGGAEDPFTVPAADYFQDTHVGGLHAYTAAQLALEGFKTLPADASKVFIATGNFLPWAPQMPRFLGLSTSKKILYDVIGAAATAYGPKGYRFYYASEISKTGGPAIPPDAQPHADVFYKLYEQKEQGQWDVRFYPDGSIAEH